MPGVFFAMEVFPNFDGLKQGSRFDMVGRAIVISANGDHLFRTSETPGSLLLIRGDLPNPVNNYLCGFEIGKGKTTNHWMHR